MEKKLNLNINKINKLFWATWRAKIKINTKKDKKIIIYDKGIQVANKMMLWNLWGIFWKTYLYNKKCMSRHLREISNHKYAEISKFDHTSSKKKTKNKQKKITPVLE